MISPNFDNPHAPGTSIPFCRIQADALGWQWQPIGPQDTFGVIYSARWRMVRHYHITQQMYWGWNASNQGIFDAYLNAISQFQRDWRSRQITWRFRFDEKEHMEQTLARLGQSNCRVESLHTHIISLEKESFEDYLWHDVSKRKHGYIRQGNSLGWMFKKITSNEQLEQFHNLHLLWGRQKNLKTYPKQFFQQMLSVLNAQCSLVGVFSGDTLLAGALLWQDKDNHVWSGISLVRSYEDHCHANDFLFGNILKAAFQQGCRIFDFGGSAGISSLESFKEHWGAEKRPFWILTWENPVWQAMLKPARKFKNK